MRFGIFDFFSGCGGTTKGFQLAGCEPMFGLDIDADAAETFQFNFPKTKFVVADISKFDSSSISKLKEKCDVTVFCGCAPCQPFSLLNSKKSKGSRDERRSLLVEFSEIVCIHEPDYVFVENVPGFRGGSDDCILTKVIEQIESIGYNTRFEVVESQRYGIPQRRRRLVLLASKVAEIDIPPVTHGPGTSQRYKTVRDCISKYPAIKHGETHKQIKNHQAARLAEINVERLVKTPPEGTRKSWPAKLRLKCHSNGYKGHTDVYGRMKWDSPSSGLTTRCISLSNGRFGHPVQNRAISLREAAAIQTFPDEFQFFGSLNSQARQVGNAVPVKLAELFGKHIIEHYKVYGGKGG